MRSLRSLFVALALPLLAVSVAADVKRIGELNTAQIRALDRTKTVVLLPGGILEEHGPYLPAWTDGILSERLTAELAQGIAAAKKDWTVLVFPQIAVGTSGYNEVGGHFSFPGTYAVRPSTLRAVFMDLASELGDQGFRWILLVHVHGAPRHNRVLDQAGDFFHDTYGGRMVHLWGLLPVLGAWGKELQTLSAAEQKEEGVSLHAGMDETSLMLHLAPELVSPLRAQAPVVTGATIEDTIKTAKAADWPGYLGSPRLANADLGGRIWRGLSGAALAHSLQILDGADPAQFARFSDYLDKNEHYAEWIRAANARDAELQAKQNAWLEKSAGKTGR
ncbi:MAG: creatininase family protein [Planctomycetota bacterium]